MSDNKEKKAATTRKARKKQGKALRERTPLQSHSEWKPAADRPDPISLLQAQDEGRIKQLLPIKYGRMLESPFTFYRGSVVVMAADLASTPVSGIDVVLCGDAHLSNFGVYATPERRLVFDVNDFDEAYPGPWEWDLKRLAASAVIAGRDNGLSENKCRGLAVVTAQVYAKAMDYFSKMHIMDQWYYHVDAESALKVFERSSQKGQKSAKKMFKKARSRTHEQTLEKLTYFDDGQRRISSDPPLLVPFREMGLEQIVGEEELRIMKEKAILDNWAQYLDSLPDERRYLLQRFEFAEAALRVGGIGSVGTRCSIVLLKGGADDDALILQLKEAGPSALEPYLGGRNFESQARRVVTAQRLMQATSDIFLGWHASQLSGRDYYWRQLKDMKGSATVAELDEEGLTAYLAICSWCLARAHSRTGDDIQIRGYLGRKDAFAEAIGDFSVAYADQTERDYQALVNAVMSGRIPAEMGI